MYIRSPGPRSRPCSRLAKKLAAVRRPAPSGPSSAGSVATRTSAKGRSVDTENPTVGSALWSRERLGATRMNPSAPWAADRNDAVRNEYMGLLAVCVFVTAWSRRRDETLPPPHDDDRRT